MSPLTTDIRSGVRRRRPRGTVAVLLVAVLAAAGLLGSCTSTPQAVLNVPGSYTADFTASILNPSGTPSATVVMCLDQASAVRLDFSQGAGYKLDWDGAVYSNYYGLPYLTATVSVTLPVLQPGCGTLGFGLTPSSSGQPRPWNLTVTASKV